MVELPDIIVTTATGSLNNSTNQTGKYAGESSIVYFSQYLLHRYSINRKKYDFTSEQTDINIQSHPCTLLNTLLKCFFVNVIFLQIQFGYFVLRR